MTDAVKDVITTWWVHLAAFGIAFLLGFVYLIIVRLFGKLLVWLVIVAMFAALLGLGIFLFFYSNEFDPADNNYKYTRYGSYGIFGLTALYLLIVVCMIP